MCLYLSVSIYNSKEAFLITDRSQQDHTGVLRCNSLIDECEFVVYTY